MAIQRVGVVGSGIMASGIAEVVAEAGFDVVLRARTKESAENCLAGVSKRQHRLVEKGKLDEFTVRETLDRIKLTDQFEDLAESDLIVETVVEDKSVKLDVLPKIAAVVRPDVPITTNTSTLAVVELAMMTPTPERVCGLHWFNPAPSMKVVEVIRPLSANDETMTAVREFAQKCGKEVVAARDEAGFVVNALLFPYLNRAVRMLERRVADAEHIDSAMKGACGYPMGPLALLDLVGLDTSLAILNVLYSETGDDSTAPAPTLRRMVAAGKLGRKTGEGFYTYNK